MNIALLSERLLRLLQLLSRPMPKPQILTHEQAKPYIDKFLHSLSVFAPNK